MHSLSARPLKSRQHSGHRRRGKVLVLFAVLLPSLLGVCGLVIDGGMLLRQHRFAQHAADSAATAAAAALADGQSSSAATATAVDYVHSYNDLGAATVSVHIPPSSGPYAGEAGFVEVQVSQPVGTFLMQAVGGLNVNTVRVSAVAGNKPATAGAAIVVLDPSPPGVELPAIAGVSLPPTPSLSLGGLEVLGIGQLKVDGAVLANTVWGGVDERGDPAGEAAGLRNAVTCMPILPLTKLNCTDLRVTGGVDNRNYYGNYQAGQPSPLRANRKPVPDPLIALPVPTVSADPVHVNSTLRGGVAVLSFPLIGPPVVLRPGVYEYIRILTGKVKMEPGVYIIRGIHPLTGISLEIIGGQVEADGVMFYLTDAAGYSAVSGSPDVSQDASTAPPLTLLPGPVSAVVNCGLLGSHLAPLKNTGSPFDGVLLYQNRTDRRIIVLARDSLLFDGAFGGTVYAKWGHVVFAAMGTFDARFVVGSMRFVNIFDVTMKPSQLLPPAHDVFLVQ